jgi:uncharacterized protein (DUF3820 family)
MLGNRATDAEDGMSERDDRQAGVPIEGSGTVPMGPGPASTFDPTRLDFGHHAGRSIAELARIDPDYLRWLARHPSGVRYRAEIARVMASAVPHAGDWQR